MAIKLHDSLTRETRELRPSHPDGVFRFYNCGPTVYAAAHIGNFRTFVVNDLLRRVLELEFGADKVKHVRNLTDVDDKTIRRSREENRPLGDVTKQWTDKFHADCAALNCLPPHVEPAATNHIPEQIDMISILEKKGHAYRTEDGSVYFKVSSYDDYGSLSRVKERELKTGSALSTKPQTHDADEKEDGSDFALWKGHKPEDGDVFWPSPWGQGRPGWHIECSAMSKKHLGDTIDLHTGGVDLLFPHHENEIAQSQCCNGTTFANQWYHSEHLLVDGKKMSKSLGNLYTLDDLRAKGVHPSTLRLSLLSGHPRKQLNFSFDSLHSAESAIGKINSLITNLGLRVFSDADGYSRLFEFISQTPSPTDSFSVYEPAWDALCDNLNTPNALAAIFTQGAKYSLPEPQFTSSDDILAHLTGLRKILYALGFVAAKQPKKVEIPADITALAEKRWAVKQAKDFAAADTLRKELTAAGWSMLDRKDGYSLEPVKK